MTIRNINPLEPDYQIPGNTEKTMEINNPYGEAGCSAARRIAKPVVYSSLKPAKANEVLPLNAGAADDAKSVYSHAMISSKSQLSV